MAPQDAAITKKRPMPRQACNRCHTAKLRCIQAPSSQRCHRCIKAGVECVHDPPQRLGRPRVNNISSPNNAPAKSTQRQENDGRASLVSESRWSTQDFDIAQTTGTAGTSPRSPVNVDSEEVAAGSMNGKGDQGSNSSDAEMGLFTGAQSQTAGLNFDIGTCSHVII